MNVCSSSLAALSDPYLCTFVDPLPSYLHIKCPICLKTLLPIPYLVSCCGHHLCEECVKQRRGKPCPLCRAKERSNSRVPDKGQQRTLNSIKVHCPNKGKSCEWVGEFGSLRNHLLKSCQLVLVNCTLKCGAKVTRRSKTVHELEQCRLRVVMCRHCRVVTCTNAEIADHEDECPKAMIHCRYKCDVSPFLRETWIRHVKECVMAPVECTFANAGCTWRGPKHTLDNHIACMWRQHVTFVGSATAQETVQKQNEKIVNLSSRITAQKDTIKHLTENIQELAQLRYKVAADRMSCLLPMNLPPIPHGKQTLKFTIEQYCRKKANGYIYQSPIFKLDKECWICLAVYLNGRAEGKGSHVSVYVQFSLKETPLYGSLLLIRLCSRRSSHNHHEKSVTFGHSSEMELVVSPGNGKQMRQTGVPQFLSHSSLEPYLKSDTLLFELPQAIVY